MAVTIRWLSFDRLRTNDYRVSAVSRSIDSISASMSSALALSCSLVSSAMGWAVRTTGYVGAPHIWAIDLAVTSNMSVQIVTDGTPAFSAWIPSCTLHALHDPQLPMATTT